MSVLIFIDRTMQAFNAYTNNPAIRGRPIKTIGDKQQGLEGDFWIQTVDLFTHLLLPTMALILISLASYTRYSRASLLEVLNQDYIRTARAKGLTERTVIMRHAFRNAMIPLATIVAFDIGQVLGGAVITERVFQWDAMGTLFFSGAGEQRPEPGDGLLPRGRRHRGDLQHHRRSHIRGPRPENQSGTVMKPPTMNEPRTIR